ncbi:MAG TPA: DUF1801 domain-containing protein [Cyclobacteriaceae bacterium]|nr:DUF1801 domain-containing protein [Cyclobacteriaceae bacterium]
MDLKDMDAWFLAKEEPDKSCLLALRSYIAQADKNITEAWKYRMPFFCYKGKMFCYLWVNKKNNLPYVGFVDGKLMSHPKLLVEKRSRMKILPIDSSKDIPVTLIKSILKEAIKLRS